MAVLFFRSYAKNAILFSEMDGVGNCFFEINTGNFSF